MKNLKVIIEQTDNGLWANIPTLPGCISFGNNFEELKKNITEAVELHIEGMKEDGENIPEFDKFEYKFDMTYIFQAFPISISGMAKKSGINRSLLSQYASGIKTPSLQQVKKVQESIRTIGEELSRISLF